MPVIDLRSDTVTRPSAGMREAIARAEVGDDVFGEDPTVNRLQALAAERVGKEAALFVPSGTMANQLAILAHTRPGDALVAGRDAHLYLYEGGGAAALAGVHSVLVGEGGFFGADDVRRAIYPHGDAHFARTRLLCFENTHNRSGGRVFPLALQRAAAASAREAGLAVHLDGARLWNAAAATGETAAALSDHADSVAFCLSKGLGAPVGSLLCGAADFVARAHRFRKMLGGAMRQVGVLAAAGLYALEHNVRRLSEDHDNARTLAKVLGAVPGLRVAGEPETNMVLFDVDDAPAFARELRARDVGVLDVGPRTIRAVTHLDVSAADVATAGARIADLAAEL